MEDELLKEGQEMPQVAPEMPAEVPADMPPEEPVRGRGAAMQRWKESNAEEEGDPEDDDLYDFSMGQADEWKSKYEGQNEVNSALANRISEDPKLAAFISGVMDNKNPAYVLAKLYGKDFMDDEDAMQAMDDGYAEYLEGTKQTKEAGQKAQENFLESMNKVDAYAEANGLGEEVVEELRMALVQGADDMINGMFSDSFIETVAKGLTYDSDVQEAADTGYVEGKNTNVEKSFGKREGEGMPSMGDASNSKRKLAVKEPEKGSFYDNMKTVE